MAESSPPSASLNVWLNPGSLIAASRLSLAPALGSRGASPHACGMGMRLSVLYEFGAHFCPYDSVITPHFATSMLSVPWQVPEVPNCALYMSSTQRDDVHRAHTVSFLGEHGCWMYCPFWQALHGVHF